MKKYRSRLQTKTKADLSGRLSFEGCANFSRRRRPVWRRRLVWARFARLYLRSRSSLFLALLCVCALIFEVVCLSEIKWSYSPGTPKFRGEGIFRFLSFFSFSFVLFLLCLAPRMTLLVSHPSPRQRRRREFSTFGESFPLFRRWTVSSFSSFGLWCVLVSAGPF